MSSKTWFLPPDFTFLPDVVISLGRVIPEPRRPTAILASLGPQSENPTIPLPEVKTIVENNRAFPAETSRSFGFELLAKFIELASANGKTDVSWSASKSYSAVRHEVRTLDGAFTPAALRAITQLDEVKEHMRSGRFGKRCAYIISGIRVALDSIAVTDNRRRKLVGSVGGSGPTPAGAVPTELEVSISGSNESKEGRSFGTAPGIVFAYRLHVIRPKRGGVEAELFSDRTAFLTGEPGDDEEEEEEEMELVAVDATVARQDLDVEVDAFDEGEQLEGGYEESYIVMK
ncbi:hypothetical protein MAPG_02987 [Magnaporthiopsis poae ATCC 64411]|uniref:Uncharacterized protein n=1 Tax=Magnaporthiopsis poae (strain ATCC 64411 / 73-15) TaxID=644358 RepID=A0A0C4DSU6_MAGP6|nr:hypothetical protein MAPG_02987 [Magnaporthiopsis poae ATCC 64411]